MNKAVFIGNLTRDPDLRTTPNGINVCTLSIAVNRKYKVQGQPEVDYIRVKVWREKGENCAKYLSKGKKVCTVGAVSVSTYTSNDGTTKAVLEQVADEVEFLSPASDTAAEPNIDSRSGYEVAETDELPF